MEDPEYLYPGFDPTSLRVAELRGILLEHNVDYPSSAKKAQLVALFTEHVAPKARRILGARSRVKASGAGILDVDGDDSLPAPPPMVEPSPRKRLSRRSIRPAAAEPEQDEDEAQPVSTSSRKRSVSARRGSVKHTRYMDPDISGRDEQQIPKSVRKTRRESSRPAVLPAARQQYSPEPIVKTPVADDSVFSSFNPFQGGSSPAVGSGKSDRRKSMPSENRQRTSSVRRRTDFPVARQTRDEDYNRIATPTNTNVFTTSRKYEVPVSGASGSSLPPRRKYRPSPVSAATNGYIKKEEEEETDGFDDMNTLEPGEEFVPEEAEEVARIEEETGPIARRPRRSSRQTTTGTSFLWIILLSLFIGYFAWWRKEKIEVGYCGYGKPDGMQVMDSDWTAILRPQCEDCPSNALCMADFKVECNDDYVLVPNPLSLGGLIPIPPTCEPDSEKLRRIAILSDEAIRVLRERAADVECGEATLANDEEAGVSEAHLRQVLYDLKAPGLSDAQFNELWRNALEDISNSEEVVRSEDSQGIKYLRSTSLASIPLSCAVRRAISGSVARYRVELAGVMLFFLLVTSLRSSITKNRDYQQKVTKLVHLALFHLARQANTHPENPHIAVAQLRDQVLQHEFNPERRKRLWEGVQKVVEMNTNVRAGEREVMGEIMRVWTWIGGKVAAAVAQEGSGGLGGGVEEECAREWGGYQRVVM